MDNPSPQELLEAKQQLDWKLNTSTLFALKRRKVLEILA